MSNQNQQNLEVLNSNLANVNHNDQNYNKNDEPNKSNNNLDIERGNDLESNEMFVKSAMRIGFIRKVYGILSMQLILTVLMASLTFIHSVRQFCLTNFWIFIVAIVLNILIIIPIICFKSVASKFPTNYLLLTAWTLCEAYMVTFICANYDPLSVIVAGALTAAVTVSLTIYAYYTKTDFTYSGGAIFVLACLILFCVIFSFFVPFLQILICSLGVLIYSAYLIYDTQLLIGKFGVEYDVDDYIIAAIMIYIDIIQIFLYLLEVFGDRR